MDFYYTVKAKRIAWKHFRWRQIIRRWHGQCKFLSTWHKHTCNMHMKQESQGVYNNILDTASTSLWYETGPKALNQEKVSSPTAADVQTSKTVIMLFWIISFTVLLLSPSWLLTDYGATCTELTDCCLYNFTSIKETMQVFYHRFSECNLVDILGLHDP